MAIVTGLTANRMFVIESASITSARREGDDLILITHGGIETNLGDIRGFKGDQGDPGLDYIRIEYALGTNPTTPPEDGWQEEIVTSSPGDYVWTRSIFVSIDGSEYPAYTVTRQGQNGNIHSVNGKTDADVVLTAEDVGAESIPSGAVMDFAGQWDNIPERWLVCDGQSYDKREEPTLFAAIGYTWGGSGNFFQVPDFNGRSTVGVDWANPQLNDVGMYYGVASNVLTASHLPPLTTQSDGAHAHTITVNSGGAHTHGIGGLGRIMTTNRTSVFSNREASAATAAVAATPAMAATSQQVGSETLTVSAGAHAHTATATSAGAHTHVVVSGEAIPVNNMPPVASVWKIIKR